MEQELALRLAGLGEVGLDGEGLVDARHEQGMKLIMTPDQGLLALMVLPDGRQVEEAHQGKAKSDLLADAQPADEFIHESPRGTALVWVWTNSIAAR